MSEWIKCSERTPQPHKAVLVYLGHGRIEVRHFEPDDGYRAWGWYPGGRHECECWMPLPEPPKD